MAADEYPKYTDSVTAPSRSFAAVSKHDTNPLARIPKAIRVGTGGTLIMRGVDDGADTTFLNVASGERIDARPQYIRASGSTAADIVAFY